MEEIEPQPSTDSPEPETEMASRRRAAVLRCCQSRVDRIKYAMEEGVMPHPDWCHFEQGDGYCKALPDIVDYESTLDFIACVVYGIGIRAIGPKEGSKLLYGAQVALSAYKSKG